MKPIVKWVGGKTQLLPQIRERLPENFNTYFEPFLGGAAVLLDLNPTTAVVSDINPELINMYEQVRDNVDSVLLELTVIDRTHETTDDPKAYYYLVREKYNKHL